MVKKSLTKNYIYNLMYQVLVMILPLITVPYISRVVGAEGIGIYSYTISITTYFITIGSLGIALYGQREVAVYQDDKHKYSKLFYEVNLLRLITLSISLVLFFLVFVLGNSQYSIYYKILLLEIFAGFVDISWFFQGHEDFKRTVLRNIIVKVVSVICIFLFVKSSQDLWIYVLIYALSVLIGNASLWLYLPQYLVKVNPKDLNIVQHIKPTIILFVPQIAVQVYTLLDKTMIGAIISDKSEVGFYDQAQKIIKLLLTIITSIGTVMMPRVAYTYSKGDKDKVEKYINNSFRIVFMISIPMVIGIYLISDQFVPLFFGPGYEVVSLLMKVISPIILFIGLSNVSGIQYLLPIKKTNQYTVSLIGGAISNFVFNMLLIPKYGALGASFGTIIAEFIVTFIQLMYIRKDINIAKVFSMSIHYIVSALVMFVVGIIISQLLTNNIIIMFIQIIVCSIVYIITLIIMKDELFVNFIKKILRKVVKRA